jgi:hypothetical protein
MRPTGARDISRTIVGLSNASSPLALVGPGRVLERNKGADITVVSIRYELNPAAPFDFE